MSSRSRPCLREGLPKQLYARLGFRPARTLVELLLLPDDPSPDS